MQKYLVISQVGDNNILTDKVIETLSKSGHQIFQINLLDYMDDEKNFLFDSDLLDAIKNFKASKTLVCAHGIRTDVTHCYIKNFAEISGNKGLSYSELAEVVRTLLPDDIKNTVPMELIMCYGARSADFENNHDIENADTINFLNSFAYRFFMAMKKTGLDLDMNAYINAVAVCKRRYLTDTSEEDYLVCCETENCHEIRENLNQWNSKQDKLVLKQNELDSLICSDPEGANVESLQHELDDVSEEIFNIIERHIIPLTDYIKEHTFPNFGKINFRSKFENGCEILYHSENQEKVLYSGEILTSEEDILNNQIQQSQPRMCMLM